MRLSDLQKKDVVNVNDGSKIGNIIDIRLDDKGNMDGFIVEKNKFIISMFTWGLFLSNFSLAIGNFLLKYGNSL